MHRRLALGLILPLGVLLAPWPQPEASDPQVARAQFTSEVVAREPTDTVTHLENDSPQVVFFAELHGLEGTTIIHRWQYRDRVMAEIALRVQGDRWRTWSTKQLLPHWLGTWTVSIIDASSTVLAKRSFAYVPAPGGEVN